MTSESKPLDLTLHEIHKLQHVNGKPIINEDNIRDYIRLYNKDKSKLPKQLQNVEIGDWDISQVSNMMMLFVNYKFVGNENINKWNVSHVTVMSGMFRGCSEFNRPLNDWDVSSVKDMQYMLSYS
jgi:surface protein